MTAPKHKGPTNPAELAGDLGIVGPMEDPRGNSAKMPDSVRAAAFKLKEVNDVAPELVEAEGRFFIVRLNGTNPPHKRTLGQADKAIRVLLVQEKLAARDRALEEELRKKFPVQIEAAALTRQAAARLRQGRHGGRAHGAGRRGRARAPGTEHREHAGGGAAGRMAASDGLAMPLTEATSGPGWTEELRGSLRTVDELARALILTPEELEGARRAEREGLPWRNTPYYLALCDWRDPGCPIRLQCVPRAEEALEVAPAIPPTRSARSRTRSRPTWCSATRIAPSSSPPIAAGSTAASAPAPAWSGTGAAPCRSIAWRRRSRTWRRTPRCATSS